MIENLTKENFWNKMQEDYPKAMQKFCAWIDKYKEENNWNQLFGQDISMRETKDTKHWSDRLAPKYHELPLAFQVGIFDEFVSSLDTDIEDKTKKYNIESYIQDGLSHLEEV